MNLSLKQQAMLMTFKVIMISVASGIAVAAGFIFLPVELLVATFLAVVAGLAIKMLYNMNLSSLESAEKIKEMQERSKS